MKIEVWSDYMCPFCYIGKRRLETAVERFGHQEQIEIVFKSFELNPHAEVSSGKSIAEELAGKFGVSVDQAREMNEQMTANARTAGLEYNMETMVPTNSFDAHRLTHWAAGQGKMKEMSEKLFSAVFTESKSVGDRTVLADLAAELGLPREEAARVLEGTEYEAEVRADEEEAGRFGITGVPFFVFDRKFAVSGAQPDEVFMQALNKAWEESQPFTVVGGDSSATCTDDGCKL